MMMMPSKAVGAAAETVTALVLYAVQVAQVVLAVAVVVVAAVAGGRVATLAMRAENADYSNRNVGVDDDEDVYCEVD